MTQKNNSNDILLAVIVSILFLLLTSCATRKVDKTEIKETETLTEKATETINENTKIVDSSETDEITFEPIDNTKEFIVNGKRHFNVKIKQSKIKRNTNIENNKKVAKNEEKQAKKVVEVKQKATKKKYNYWWLLIPIGLAYLYFRFKSKFV